MTVTTTKTRPKTPAGKAASPRDKIARLVKEVTDSLIDRDEEVLLTATALFGQSTLLLIGPPGSAKSLTLDRFIAQVTGGKKFGYLMGKFTEPDEIFGPVDLMALKNGKRRRITDGRLPEAHVVFLDEFWKASTAVGNTLLKIVNERVFENGEGDYQVPLRCLVAASNEYPQDGELGAMFDRFLLRKNVSYLRSAKSREALVFGAEPPLPNMTVSLDELDRAKKELGALEFEPAAKSAFLGAVEECIAQGIRPSDRRLKALPNLVRAYAYVQGAEVVRAEHLEVLAHALWSNPEGEPEKVAKIVARVANPVGMKVAELLAQAESVFGRAPKDNYTPQDGSALAGAITKTSDIRNELGRMKETPATLKSLEYVSDMLTNLNRRLINVPEKE